MTDDQPALSLDDECFFITPIGADDSPERRRADGILASVVEPAAESHGLVAVRADRIAEGGNVSLQVLEHCIAAKVAIADLTGLNPNVFYEVGIRHAFRKPLILIADADQRLPFDLLQQRTIFYVDDMAGAVVCRERVADQIGRALTGHVDSPVELAASVEQLSGGSGLERIVGELVEKVDGLSSQVQQVRRSSDSTRRRLSAGGRAADVLRDHFVPSGVRHLEGTIHAEPLQWPPEGAVEAGTISGAQVSEGRDRLMRLAEDLARGGQSDDDPPPEGGSVAS